MKLVLMFLIMSLMVIMQSSIVFGQEPEAEGEAKEGEAKEGEATVSEGSVPRCTNPQLQEFGKAMAAVQGGQQCLVAMQNENDVATLCNSCESILPQLEAAAKEGEDCTVEGIRKTDMLKTVETTCKVRAGTVKECTGEESAEVAKLMKEFVEEAEEKFGKSEGERRLQETPAAAEGGAEGGAETATEGEGEGEGNSCFAQLTSNTAALAPFCDKCGKALRLMYTAAEKKEITIPECALGGRNVIADFVRIELDRCEAISPLSTKAAGSMIVPNVALLISVFFVRFFVL